MTRLTSVQKEKLGSDEISRSDTRAERYGQVIGWGSLKAQGNGTHLNPMTGFCSNPSDLRASLPAV
jgi:hypothetical protein